MYVSVFSISGVMKPFSPSGNPPVSMPSRCTSGGIIAEPSAKMQPSDVARPGRPRLCGCEFAMTIGGDDVVNNRIRLGHHQRAVFDYRGLAGWVNAIKRRWRAERA